MLIGLIAHITAGSMAIVSGGGAAITRKGSRLHRAFGQTFAGSMIVMATLGAYLALFTTPAANAATPPEASATIAVLTLYLVLTAWLTVRHRRRAIGVSEYGGFAFASTITMVLAVLGIISASDPSGQKLAGPYFAFATFTAVAGAMDLKVILKGGIDGGELIARHLWRMCVAWFFASAFFFIGQQKVMPAWMRGSPALVVIAMTPLLVMVIWLVRIRATQAIARGIENPLVHRLIGLGSFKPAAASSGCGKIGR
jgi:hypothetical protein